jgi:hypothetical protein
MNLYCVCLESNDCLKIWLIILSISTKFRTFFIKILFSFSFFYNEFLLWWCPVGYSCSWCYGKVSVWSPVWLDCPSSEPCSPVQEGYTSRSSGKLNRSPWYLRIWGFWLMQQVIWTLPATHLLWIINFWQKNTLMRSQWKLDTSFGNLHLSNR